MTRYSYPHTIENGAGERITFTRTVDAEGRERLEGENVVTPGHGPPMHAHLRQEEVLTVRRGRLAWQRPGQAPHFAGPGETVVFPPGDAHKFWNAGDDDLVCTGYVTPVHNLEYFLTEMFASTARHGKGRPDPFEAAFLVTRYRSELAMVEIPAAVRRVVFPVLVAAGRLLGRYARYADAPPPI
jgi:quercetin dioxygenase-like cupin family protein